MSDIPWRAKSTPQRTDCSRRECGVKRWPRAEPLGSKVTVRKEEHTGKDGGDCVTDGVASGVTVYKEGFGDKRGLGSGESFMIFQGAIPTEPPERAFFLFASLFPERYRSQLPPWAINETGIYASVPQSLPGCFAGCSYSFSPIFSFHLFY